jgi:hypothetical protein
VHRPAPRTLLMRTVYHPIRIGPPAPLQTICTAIVPTRNKCGPMSLNPSENIWDELPAACLQVRACTLVGGGGRGCSSIVCNCTLTCKCCSQSVFCNIELATSPALQPQGALGGRPACASLAPGMHRAIPRAVRHDTRQLAALHVLQPVCISSLLPLHTHRLLLSTSAVHRMPCQPV